MTRMIYLWNYYIEDESESPMLIDDVFSPRFGGNAIVVGKRNFLHVEICFLDSQVVDISLNVKV